MAHWPSDTVGFDRTSNFSFIETFIIFDKRNTFCWLFNLQKSKYLLVALTEEEALATNGTTEDSMVEQTLFLTFLNKEQTRFHRFDRNVAHFS
jgi:hypothetical protein